MSQTPKTNPVGWADRAAFGEPAELTDDRIQMLVMHARHVQGGFSTAEVETERARAQLAGPHGAIDWTGMGAQLDAALAAGAQTVVPAAVPFNPDYPDPADDDAPPVADNDGQLPVALLRRYVELRRAQTAGEAEAKAFKEEANVIEGQLVEAFAEAGMQNINIDGKTVYLHRSTFAVKTEAASDPDVFKAALRAAGAGDLIGETINAQTLSAYVRELLDDDDAPGLPEPLKGMLEVGERFAVRVTAGSSKAKRR